MASASTRVSIAPLDEKVAAVERQVQNTQYALKFVGAAFSNMASSATVNPTDIIKVRQQLRTQTPGGGGNAFWSVGVEMARTEGIRSLAGGISASMLREVVYSGIRMGTYELFKDKLHDASKGALSREGLPLKITAASVAATIGSALANPADLVKVRMQAYYPNGSPYRNLRHAFATIYQDGARAAVAAGTSPAAGGIRSLYRGVGPTTIRGIVLSGTQICSYDQIKQTLKKRGIMQEGVSLHFVASTFAGFFCSVTSNPVDVVKVRLMNDKNHQFKGAFDCVRQITVKEGPFGFFKGFGMCWARDTFDPHDARRIKHTKFGAWDLYEEREPKLARIQGSSRLEKYMDLLEGLPYVWRMLKDVLSIPTCALLLLLYAVAEVGQAIFPALGLWYQGQLLNIMQVAIDTRTVDANHLLHVSARRIACSLAKRAMGSSQAANLQRQLDEVSPESAGKTVAFETLETAATFIRSGTQVVAQGFALVQVLGGHRDGFLLCFSSLDGFHPIRVWAATTTNEDYVKMQGWRRVVGDVSHRKEVVAGNLGEYASSEFKKASDRVGDKAGDFKERQRWEHVRQSFGLWSLFEDPFQYIPHIVFTLRAIQYPASIPISLASLHLIQQAMAGLISNLYHLLDSTSSVSEQLAAVRTLYEVGNIRNKVRDGTVPFPEDAAQIKSGITVEFRNVSFKYPGAEAYALRNISFTLAPGQLSCVIVGVSGSGKSTILKLIVRLYDPDEGKILIGGHDIRTFKLYDLRQAISVLFQDFTHFPLSVRDNIAIGDPSAAGDDDYVRLAARLGGTEPFIEKLPDGFNTYLDRPVRDYYGGLPEGTKTLFGRNVDYGVVRSAGGMKSVAASALSGGQMQRLAVARTFMRSVVSEETKVGLFLFDEPSASLDPVAEHDLFNRLRELRGSKTMLFSSHRFGNLTRHADLILYMNESVVVEAGTHEGLLTREGEYAKIWNLQAHAFI
ncbi:hypothetical protein V8D89_003142 [Ganoderma adspersum]